MDQLLFNEDTYRTAPRRISAVARALPSFLFYCRTLMIVFRGSALAKKGRYNTAEWCKSSLATLHALEEVGVRIEITGIDYVRTLDRPCVFIANHMSTLETFVLPTIISSFREATFVVKQSLVEYPVFKHIMRSRNPVTVGRSNPRDDLKAVLEGGSERLLAGTAVIIFPQTTRTPIFDPVQFNTIGIKLAKKAGVPVIPIALKTDAWGNGRCLKDYGRIKPSRSVHFAFGKPITISGRGTEEHAAVIEFITGKLNEWEKEPGREESKKAGLRRPAL